MTEWEATRWVPQDDGERVHIDAVLPLGYTVRNSSGFCLNDGVVLRVRAPA